MELKQLLLRRHMGIVQVVAAHFILILQQHLSVGQRGCVPDVLEVLHSLRAGSKASSTQFSMSYVSLTLHNAPNVYL